MANDYKQVFTHVIVNTKYTYFICAIITTLSLSTFCYATYSTDTMTFEYEGLVLSSVLGQFVILYDDKKPVDQRVVFGDIDIHQRVLGRKAMLQIDDNTSYYKYDIPLDKEINLRDNINYFIANDVDNTIDFVSPVFMLDDIEHLVSFKRNFVLEFYDDFNNKDQRNTFFEKYNLCIVEYYEPGDLYIIDSNKKNFFDLVDLINVLELESEVKAARYSLNRYYSFLFYPNDP